MILHVRSAFERALKRSLWVAATPTRPQQRWRRPLARPASLKLSLLTFPVFDSARKTVDALKEPVDGLIMNAGWQGSSRNDRAQGSVNRCSQRAWSRTVARSSVGNEEAR